MNDREAMALALKLAEQAEIQNEVPIGAVLVCEGKVIGEGFNRRESEHRTISHAEMVAVEAYNIENKTWRLPANTTLYVTVEPCLMCTGMLLQARADRIVFGCEDNKRAGLLRILPEIQLGIFDHRFQEVKTEPLENACANLISQFFKKKRSAVAELKCRSHEPDYRTIDPHNFPQVTNDQQDLAPKPYI